jgi:hypothetical protein
MRTPGRSGSAFALSVAFAAIAPAGAPAGAAGLNLLTGAAAATTPAAGATSSAIDATIEPQQISLGESARLTILTAGSGTLSVPLPVVAGLEFRVVGERRQVQMINGAAIETTSFIVRVTADSTGVFSIPGFTPKSPPLELRVIPGTRAGAAATPDEDAFPGRGALIPGTTNANGIRLTPDGSAFVRLSTPKHEIYVGESIPVEIQVGMRDGFAVSVNGLPKLNSGDFTLNNLSRQPERTAKAIDGKPFTVITWRSLLSAIKPGSYALTFEAPVTVKIRTRPPRESMLDDLLGDPFMQNIYGATVQKELNVSSPAAAFTVLALPTEGRPADFGGAVGSFKVSTDLSSANTAAGDPLTLRMHVSGTGNFDRVATTMFAGDGEWKTYEPKASFNSPDPTGYRGEKIFEQPLIAVHPGTQTIPAIPFSYFDPGTRRYETARSAPLTIAVSPSAADSAASAPPAAADSAGTTIDATHGGLRPDHAATGAASDTLVPLYLQPRFAGLSSALALLFGGGWLALRRRERGATDARTRTLSERTESFLRQMAAAAAAGDSALFLTAARAAIQQSLGERRQIAPNAITAADVDAQLGHDADGIAQIFALADEANYAGGSLQRADFERWTLLVRRHLTSEPSS